MLVVDSAAAARKKEQDFNAAAFDRTVDAARGETRHAPLIADKNTSIANKERQLSHAMTTTRFAELIRGLNRDLIVLPHPRNDTKACVYLLLPAGVKEFCVVMENGLMPEWSLMGTTEVRTPDGPVHDMWKKTKVPYVEVLRGWRTVLIYLIRKRLLTLESVERTFGPCDRESWATLTGKRRGTPPI